MEHGYCLSLKMIKNLFVKTILFVFPLIFKPSLLTAQKFDNIWVFGYNWDTDAEGETYRLIFDTFPPRIEEYPGDLFIDYSYASICDSIGKLQLYTNNCRIADWNGDVIVGGDTMTQGWELDWCELYGWYPSPFINTFIHLPDNYGDIALFSKATYQSTTPPLVIYQNKFRYAIIDMDQNGGNGAVVMKNISLVEDRLGYGQVTAVKHGNGRDWWLPMPVEIGDKIYMVLLSKDTAYLHHAQNLGPAWDEDGGFQASFSPDGSKYVRYNRFQGVYIYDFDRCNGMLSNVLHFPFNDTTQGIFGGCAVSPNNRYMYIADFDYLYQFDLWADDIQASKQLVAVYDGFLNNFPTKFSYIIHGPDGRMYVIPPSTTKSIHIINRPNMAGPACDFRQHAIDFPNPYINTPNHPNYRLGPLDGSPCDTLGFDNHPLANFRPEPADSNSLALYFWDVSAYEPAQWYWEFDDGTVSQDTSPVHTFPGPGFYTVCLTVSNEYGADTNCKVVEVTTSSSSSEQEGGEIKFYPNPTTGEIRWEGLENEEVVLRVYDALGRPCLQQTTNDSRADLSGLPPGLYYWQMVAERKRVYTGKMEKQ